MAGHRDELLAIYRAALAAVEGRRRVADTLAARPLPGPLYVVAVGKAAAAMARGALDAQARQIRALLVITRHGYDQGIRGAHPGLVLQEAGHPVPDAGSLRAGELLLEMIATAPAAATFLFLTSGGASALVEVPRPGISLADLQRANRWLLGAGLPIAAMNAVRKALSRIKGGGLLPYLAGRRVWHLAISDVPGDDPAVIGSGLLVRDGGGMALPRLPAWLQTLLRRAGEASSAPPATPPDVALATRIIASNREARHAAAAAGRERGYTVHCHDTLLTGDVEAASRQVGDVLRAGAPGLHVWGGEVTVRLPVQRGEGGRCQHLALLVARQLAATPGALFLAAASDGSDGSAETAGALVDAASIERGRRAGLDEAACLAGADAGRFLRASGDLVVTGVTGSNVMDIMLGLRG